MSKEQNEILWQSGTNEIEIFEFVVDGVRYGVNALKVKQVNQFQPDKIQQLPMMPVGMMGTMILREEVIKIVDLRIALGLTRTQRAERSILLFCEFNRQVIGFLVDEILGIHRVNWSQVQSPSSLLNTTSITGVALIGNQQVSMLDVESLILTMFGSDIKFETKEDIHFPADFKILVADDSPLIRKKIKWLLDKLQAQDVEMFENGAQLFQRFSELHSSQKKVGLVLTDIEMPQVDGFACCKKIKTMAHQVPVVIFSSLINEQIERKCKEVGADVALNKEDFEKLSATIANLVTKDMAAAA
jgi:two-component system chemotaxis response regulator CheV